VELRPDVSSGPIHEGQTNRMIYKVDTATNGSMNLSRVRLGTSGIHDLFETPVTLTPVTEN